MNQVVRYQVDDDENSDGQVQFSSLTSFCYHTITVKGSPKHLSSTASDLDIKWEDMNKYFKFVPWKLREAWNVNSKSNKSSLVYASRICLQMTSDPIHNFYERERFEKDMRVTSWKWSTKSIPLTKLCNKWTKSMITNGDDKYRNCPLPSQVQKYHKQFKIGKENEVNKRLHVDDETFDVSCPGLSLLFSSSSCPKNNTCNISSWWSSSWWFLGSFFLLSVAQFEASFAKLCYIK